MSDRVAALQQQIKDAAACRRALRVVGSGSKDFYGAQVQGERLSTEGLEGIVDYEPSELVMTVQAGTALADVEAVLAERGQMLAFEPPRFDGGGTVGGAVASGLSGPRRAYVGAVRDFVLGVRIIDGQGAYQRFGGQVIKNVAGFDVARLMAGSQGSLGLITEVSLKTLPKPAYELSLRQQLDEPTALRRLNEWAARPLPISASCWIDGRLSLRLSGAEAAVREARARLGGDILETGAAFWDAVRDQSAAFFAQPGALWRVSLPSTVEPLGIRRPQLIEWGGALRWVVAENDGADLSQWAAARGGHATRFRSPLSNPDPFTPLPAGLAKLHARLKASFDPAGIFNPGRLYAGL
jgi:glycolate oxidase FAD binding subunit